MAAASPPFDAKRLAQFMALMDSPSDGEAQSALMQARLMLHKAGLPLVDALETDAYLDAITRQVKPGCTRSGNGAELQRLREDCQKLAVERDTLYQTGEQMLQDLEQLAQEYDALAEQLSARGQTSARRPWAAGLASVRGARPIIGLLFLSLVFGGAQWWSTNRYDDRLTGTGVSAPPAVKAPLKQRTDTTVPLGTGKSTK